MRNNLAIFNGHALFFFHPTIFLFYLQYLQLLPSSPRARTENYKPWETEQEEGETGEDSGEDSEDVVTAVTAEGAEEVTASILCIHRFTRHSKTHRSSFPPRGEIWRVRSNL